MEAPVVDESSTEYVPRYVQHFSADDVINISKQLHEEASNECEIIHTSVEMQRVYYSHDSDVLELKNLLASWNLSILFDYFEKQQLYVGVLKHFPDQLVPKLFEGTNVSMGMQGEFVHHWSAWKSCQSLEQLVPAISLQPIDNAKIQPVIEANIPKMFVQSSTSINLHNIISSSSPYGKIVCDYQEKHGELDERTRKLLVEAFLQYCVSNNIETVSKGQCKTLATEIVSAFPGEALGYYYVERPGAPLGKLYNKFHNWKSSKLGKSSESKITKSAQKRKHLNQYQETENEEENIRSLIYDNLSFDDKLNRWKGCVATRLNMINVETKKKSIFESWPQYKEPYGYKLLESDFNHVFGTKNRFLDEHNEFVETMISRVLPGLLKNTNDIDLLKQITLNKDNLNRNAICAAVFRLIQSLLPNGKIVKMLADCSNPKRKRKAQKNFTLEESRDAFIAVCENKILYKEYFDAKVLREFSVPPFITIIGTVLAPTAIYCDFENLTYKMESLPRAIDICFKAYNLFNWEYSPAARLMWQFINKQFYELPDESPNPVVHVLIKNIKDAKQKQEETKG